MAIGGRRAAPGAATGPAVGPRLVPVGAAPWAAPDSPRLTELRFLAIEEITPTGTATEAGGTGVVEVVLQVPNDRVWSIERIAVSTNSGSVTAAAIYAGSADPQNLVDFTPAGNGDIADEINPVLLPAGSVLRIRWTGLTAGATAAVRCQGKAGSLAQVAV